jgi:hypothetical protein
MFRCEALPLDLQKKSKRNVTLVTFLKKKILYLHFETYYFQICSNSKLKDLQKKKQRNISEIQ